jgi:hypothetical protein
MRRRAIHVISHDPVPPELGLRLEPGGRFQLPSGSPFLYNSYMVGSRVNVKQKRKPGRPATGQTPLVAFRPPVELTKAIDAWAADRGVSRSEAMRLLIEAGLRRHGRTDRKCR